MININLLPENLQKKKKGIGQSLVSYGIPQEAVIGLVGGLTALMVIAIILLQIAIFTKWAQRTALKKQWEALLPQKEVVDKVLTELRMFKNKIESIEKVTTGKRIFWSPKLNAISDSIPRGVWLSLISLDNHVLLLDGSAVSKNLDEMISAGNFATNLKSHNAFMERLESLYVRSIQKRQIKSVEIADFLITIKLQGEK